MPKAPTVPGSHLCPHCPRTFTRPRDVTRHVEGTHLSVKYACTVCSYTTAQRDNCRRHMLLKHKMTDEDAQPRLATPSSALPSARTTLARQAALSQGGLSALAAAATASMAMSMSWPPPTQCGPFAHQALPRPVLPGSGSWAPQPVLLDATPSSSWNSSYAYPTYDHSGASTRSVTSSSSAPQAPSTTLALPRPTLPSSVVPAPQLPSSSGSPSTSYPYYSLPESQSHCATTTSQLALPGASLQTQAPTPILLPPLSPSETESMWDELFGDLVTMDSESPASTSSAWSDDLSIDDIIDRCS
ncbi:hypothetical protein EXIGLDRAFT_796770 [Exidia glandulosa HHB12029]|uniref:C2H2-type domain-containing protein n=1 Tax=Exidia glandulosa HHB12029 TaxID=1314781 RepID=A0A165QGI5_EXIGL|nr:hypothetical protein EXIGLDRAFT_796770 [Exidia glandulosa HHB12029]